LRSTKEDSIPDPREQDRDWTSGTELKVQDGTRIRTAEGTGISELEVEIQSQRGELNTGNKKPHYRRVTPLDEQEKS
jgi:hypothetical protein